MSAEYPYHARIRCLEISKDEMRDDNGDVLVGIFSYHARMCCECPPCPHDTQK